MVKAEEQASKVHEKKFKLKKRIIRVKKKKKEYDARQEADRGGIARPLREVSSFGVKAEWLDAETCTLLSGCGLCWAVSMASLPGSREMECSGIRVLDAEEDRTNTSSMDIGSGLGHSAMTA